MSYTLKMLPKKGITPEGYRNYTVFPLEGLWDMVPDGLEASAGLDKDSFIWEIMIRQPDFVTQELFDLAKEMLVKKKDAPDLSGVELRTITDGLSVQMMHVGPYDTEPASFAMMDEFCATNGYTRAGYQHREIYMSDPRRVAPEKMKTVIRYFVRKG